MRNIYVRNASLVGYLNIFTLFDINIDNVLKYLYLFVNIHVRF